MQHCDESVWLCHWTVLLEKENLGENIYELSKHETYFY